MEIAPTTLDRLSFGRVQAALAERAATFLGVELASTATPMEDQAEVERALERVQEVVDGGDLALGGIEDVRPLLARIRDGNLLDGREILTIAYTLDGAATLRRGIVASDRPALTELAVQIGSFDGALRLVREQLDPDGNVRDDATPKLHDIRRRLNPLRGRIRERLARLLETYADAVQDPIVTLRRDRYVIPVKANAQARVPGLALDRSDSGATVFIEPASVVPLNNELALLEMEERDEVRRILLALGRRLADEPRVDESLEVVAQLDVVNASARLAKDWRLTRPTFDDGGRVRLKAARHPLIDGCVPNDVALDERQRFLIVTGPNAGGKTVLLKTLGLAAAMAHAGMFVAADASTPPLLPRVRALLADIGDEQSIEASLSTYAGHLRNLKAIVERADDDVLVLIDELGSGTDPDEGAALSQAILERLLASGARGLVTTHLAPLKVFASEQEGVRNAAMRFDLDHLRPTYQLVLGQPGRSYALSIAARLGLDEQILERGSELLGPEGERLESLLETLESQRERLEEELAEAHVSRRQALEEAELLRAQIDTLRSRERELMAAAAERADEMLQETMQRAAKLKRTATQEPEQRSKALEEIQRLRRDARRMAGRDVGSRRPHAGEGAGSRADGAVTADPLGAGAPVRVESYGAEGSVLERRGDQVLVQLGLLKVEVPVRDVRPLVKRDETPSGTGLPGGKLARNAQVRSRGGGASAGGATGAAIGTVAFERELNVRGERVEQALDKVRDFVLEAHAMKAGSVRILHGKGTGALRDAVRQYLKSERFVERFEDAVPYEGGHGVTVAYLRE
ncbi:MAG: endonuclease MutS2 [Trueperaceae bacterium]